MSDPIVAPEYRLDGSTVPATNQTPAGTQTAPRLSEIEGKVQSMIDQQKAGMAQQWQEFEKQLASMFEQAGEPFRK